MKTKRIYVYCKDTNKKGVIAYYVESSEGVCICCSRKNSVTVHTSTFTQDFRLKKQSSTHLTRMQPFRNTIRRILPSIHYIEKTYDVQLLNKSKKVA